MRSKIPLFHYSFISAVLTPSSSGCVRLDTLQVCQRIYRHLFSTGNQLMPLWVVLFSKCARHARKRCSACSLCGKIKPLLTSLATRSFGEVFWKNSQQLAGLDKAPRTSRFVAEKGQKVAFWLKMEFGPQWANCYFVDLNPLEKILEAPLGQNEKKNQTKSPSQQREPIRSEERYQLHERRAVPRTLFHQNGRRDYHHLILILLS